MLLELATFCIDSVPLAEKAGVQRLELCEQYACGGVTPGMEYFIKARALFSGEIFVMVRPRDGGYIYSDDEFKVMLDHVKAFHRAGADGFVGGFFSSPQEIHEVQLKEFIEACDGRPVTFHRSFDALTDWKKGLDILMKSGCSRLLTSGDGIGAFEGRFRLAEMIAYAGENLKILPGGGIRSSNVMELMEVCQPTEIHTAALRKDGSELVDETELGEIIRLIN